eukprot:Awhi_evm1s4552
MFDFMPCFCKYIDDLGKAQFSSKESSKVVYWAPIAEPHAAVKPIETIKSSSVAFFKLNERQESLIKLRQLRKESKDVDEYDAEFQRQQQLQLGLHQAEKNSDGKYDEIHDSNITKSHMQQQRMLSMLRKFVTQQLVRQEMGLGLEIHLLEMYEEKERQQPQQQQQQQQTMQQQQRQIKQQRQYLQERTLWLVCKEQLHESEKHLAEDYTSMMNKFGELNQMKMGTIESLESQISVLALKMCVKEDYLRQHLPPQRQEMRKKILEKVGEPLNVSLTRFRNIRSLELGRHWVEESDTFFYAHILTWP